MYSEGSRSTDMKLAYALLRLVLGLNITVHGVSRLYAGSSRFADTLVAQFQKAPLPPSAVHAFGLILPWTEAIIGVFLLFGLYTRYACVLGLLLIATLTFGSGLLQNWDAAGDQLIYALAYAALLGWRRHNLISLDGWLFGGEEHGLSQQTGKKAGPSTTLRFSRDDK